MVQGDDTRNTRDVDSEDFESAFNNFEDVAETHLTRKFQAEQEETLDVMMEQIRIDIGNSGNAAIISIPLWPPVNGDVMKKMQIDHFLTQTIENSSFLRGPPTVGDEDGTKYIDSEVSFVRSVGRFATSSQKAYSKSWNHFALVLALLIVHTDKLWRFPEALTMYVEALHGDIAVPEPIKTVMPNNVFKGNTLITITSMIGHYYKHTRNKKIWDDCLILKEMIKDYCKREITTKAKELTTVILKKQLSICTTTHVAK